jgi:hypothetical protein
MSSFRHTTGILLAAGILATAVQAAQRGPAPTATNLPPDVLGLACAPVATPGEPPMPLRITGGQDSSVRHTYSPGDLVTINAGIENGIEVGQEYFVRRLQLPRFGKATRSTPGNIHTAGWIRVWAVDDTMSLATITHACDAIQVGDFLEPFVLPLVPVPAAERLRAERDNYGRVMSGVDLRQSFGKGDFFVVDRGSLHGVTPGARFAIFRDKRQDENFLFDLGEAVAVTVQDETSTLQVTVSRDAIAMGDYVALRR